MTNADRSTFERVLEAVNTGAAVAGALIPFLALGPAYVQQILASWRALGLTDEEIKAHVLASELEVHDFDAWLQASEAPLRHPDSKIQD